MKYYFSIKRFWFKTHYHWQLKLVESLTDAAGIYAYISDCPSQKHPFHVILWQVNLIFMLVLLSKGSY